MADDLAADGYERYYAEKLWEMLPSLYRHEDGIAERPGTLRAFVEMIAEQVARLRRSHDRLWDDAFIDLCDDWAVPYLGDLVGTRMVSALNQRARRVDVAKTIYYRRRKGTPRVLEELIADITGWEGKVVESFRGLGRTFHHLDPALADRLEPARGWADLRQPRLAELTGGPWDPFAHTPDLRRPRGDDGRWNIPRVSFHLFRLAAFHVPADRRNDAGATPHVRADGASFTFDPSGRDYDPQRGSHAALFMPRRRDASFSWDDWQSARPWEVPAPMGCRILNHAEYVIDEGVLAALTTAGAATAVITKLTVARDVHFPSESALHDYLELVLTGAELSTLETSGQYDVLRATALLAECGKAALWPDAVLITPSAGGPIARERMSAADLGTFGVTADNLDLLVDPLRGRFELFTAPAQTAAVRVEYWYGFGGQVGAGTYDRRTTVVDLPHEVVPPAALGGGALIAAHYRVIGANILGVTEIPDSATYDVQASPSDVEALTIQAGNLTRPYLRLAGDWVFTAAAGLEATLTLDGLWVGARAAAAIVLRGAWSKVTIRWSTLDPGGTDVDGATLHPVPIVVEGQVDTLEITSSITARIGTRAGGVIDALVVSDSIVDATAPGPTPAAIVLGPGTVTLQRVTVLGGVDVERLEATAALITDHVDVTDLQVGCFRFSSAPPGSRLPRPYRWVPWNGGSVFASTRFGDPGYTWLAESAPAELRTGGEHGTEIGVWNSALNPIKEAGLLRKVEEYLPFGLAPMFIRET